MLGPALAACLLAAALLAGCGDDGDSGGEAATIDVRIAFDGDGGTVARTLTCAPSGGSWPRPDAACDRLLAEPGLLEPIAVETRDLVPITPIRLRVTGTARGETVDLDFPRSGSGTRRGRLVALREALGPSAYDAVAREAAQG